MPEKFNAISPGVDEYIMRLEEENRNLRDKNKALERYAELCRFSDLEEETDLLTKAKEIIKGLLELGSIGDGDYTYVAEAEQFLKEVDK